MAKARTRLTVEVDYNAEITDPESLATAADRLMETICSTPGILDDYGNPTFGEFFVAEPIDSVDAGPHRVVVNVHGGVVQNVYCSAPQARTVIVDWDNEGRESCEDGIVEVQMEDGHKPLAHVAEYLTQPFAELPGTDVEKALTAAELSEDWFVPGNTGLTNAVEGQPSYSLNIGGPEFRKQRELLQRLRGSAVAEMPYWAAPGEAESLEGLINLTDAIADQAHDNHGVDCLLDTGDGPCECESPGHFRSGVPGILAHMEGGRLAPGAKVERCDLCGRYPTDEAALEKLRELGHGPS